MTKRYNSDGVLVDLTPDEEKALANSPAPPVAPKYFISKVEMWRRCTDDEAEQLYADLRNAPARYQALFDGASIIDTRDELFPVLQSIVVARTNADRAAVILTPTS